MAEADQVSQSPSAEAQELMAEMRSEGFVFEGDDKAKADPVAPEAEADAPKDAEKAAEEPEKKPEPEAKPEEDQRPDVKEEKTERTSRYVPVSKHNEERHKRQDAEKKAQEAESRYMELKAEIEALRTRQAPKDPTVSVKDRIAKLAETHNVDPAFASDLADSLMEGVRSATQMPQDLVQRLERFEASQKEAEMKALEAKQELFFEQEFAKAAEEYPALVSRKEELKQAAFSEEGAKVPLRYLVLELLHENPDIAASKGRRSAETSSSMSRERRADPASDDFEHMTEEKLLSMKDAEVDRYYEWVKANKKR
jgi:hypothetical protein